MAERFDEIRIRVDFPALDNLVEYLRGRGNSGKQVHFEIKDVEVNGSTMRALLGDPIVKVEPAATVTMPTTPVVEAPKAETKPELKLVPVPDEEIPEQFKEEPKTEAPARQYTADEVATAAMRLRDDNPENLKAIKAKFPEVGIRALSELRKNPEACNKLAEILIGMGAVI